MPSLQCSTHPQGRAQGSDPLHHQSGPQSLLPPRHTAHHHRLCQCWEYSQLHFPSEFKYQCRTGTSGEQGREGEKVSPGWCLYLMQTCPTHSPRAAWSLAQLAVQLFPWHGLQCLHGVSSAQTNGSAWPWGTTHPSQHPQCSV